MPALKLYMTPGSCSTAIHILLEELEEAFEVYIVNLRNGDQFKADYVAVNPKSTIPAVVRSDGTILTEVPAIAYWLGRSRVRAGLWPSTLEGEVRVVEAMAYVTGTVHGQGFARIFAASTFASNPQDHAEVQALGRRMVAQGFSILEASMPDDGFLAGGFSVADPVLFYVEFWADKTSIPLPPRLAAHYRKMLARPAVQRVLREEGYDLGKLGQGRDLQ